MTQRKALACPECFSDPGGNCDRCKGTGTISVVVPDGGVPDEMHGLISERFAKYKRGIPIASIAGLAFILAAIVVFTAAAGIGIHRFIETMTP